MVKGRTGIPERLRKEVLDAFAGKCARCEQAIVGPWHCDHEIPYEFVREHTLDNLRPLCVPCHKIKTKQDKADIARAKRLSGETRSQYQRRKERGPQIKGRGFQGSKDFQGNINFKNGDKNNG